MPPEESSPEKKADPVDPLTDSHALSEEKNLRRQAEKKLSERRKKTGPLPASEGDLRRLVHELEVHQIELEMQNENLKQAQAESEAALDQYTDLYDFAPVGYFRLARDGTILQVNLTGANLLGMERGSLVRRRFGLFVYDEFRASFTDFLEELFECREKGNGEFILKKDGHGPLWVQIEASCLEDGQVCRAIVADTTNRKQTEAALLHNRKLLLALSQAAQTVQQARTLEQVFHAVGKEIKKLGYDLIIFTLMEDHRYMNVTHTTFNPGLLRAAEKLTGVKTDIFPVPIQSGSIFERVVSGGEAEFLDWTGDTAAQLLPSPLRPLAGQLVTLLKIERAIVAALRVEGATLGVLAVTGLSLSVGDAEAIEAFAAQIAISLQNAKLSQHMQQELIERTQTEQRYRTLTNQIPSIVYIDDATTDPPRTQYISPYVEEMLGYTPEEWLEGGYDFWVALIYREDRERILNTYLSSLEREGTLNIEYRLYSKTGQIVWVQDQANVLRDERGKPRSIHGLIHNITERKQAEQELIAIKDELERFFQLVPDLICIASTDGYFKKLNPAWEATLGFTLTELYDEPFESFIHPDDIEPTRREYAGQLGGNYTISFVNRYRAKDGSYRLLEWHGAPAAAGSLYAVARDITERKLAEKRLRQSQRQLRALTNYQQTAIEEERAHIARELHDQFGQLLAGLKMDLSWLASHLEANSEHQERFRSMNHLIDEAIDVIRRIASELRPGLLDDLGLFPALEWLMNEFNRRSDISCTLILPPEEPDLEPDLNTALFRILQESLTNVTRHAQASKVEARLTVSNDELQMELTDNGRGISKGELQHVDSYGLLGMQERVALWGGTLQITGEEGKGTTVMVNIPLPALRQKNGP